MGSGTLWAHSGTGLANTPTTPLISSSPVKGGYSPSCLRLREVASWLVLVVTGRDRHHFPVPQEQWPLGKCPTPQLIAKGQTSEQHQGV